MHIHLLFPGEKFTHYWMKTKADAMLDLHIQKLATWKVIHNNQRWTPKSGTFKTDGKGSVIFVVQMEEYYD